MTSLNKNNESIDSNNTHKPRPLIDMLISIIIPSFILMKLSTENNLGATNALILALAFPLGWGLYELIKYKKYNFIAILGLVSVSLTGGIGLLQLDVQWLAIKEAAIPALIGTAILISTQTKYPLIKTFIFNLPVLNVALIQDRIKTPDHQYLFESQLMKATFWLSGTFFFSATMNYILTKWIVTSPSGTAAFNEELGRLTLMSYPMIAIPSMLMMMGILYYIWRTLHGMTGLELEQILVSKE